MIDNIARGIKNNDFFKEYVKWYRKENSIYMKTRTCG